MLFHDRIYEALEQYDYQLNGVAGLMNGYLVNQ